MKRRVRLFIPPLCHDDCGQATPEAGKPARHMAGKRSGKYKMKGFFGVTDNVWFAFLSHQPVIDEVNFWQPGGRRLK